MNSTTMGLLVLLGALFAYWAVRKTKGPVWFAVKVVVVLTAAVSATLFISSLSGESGRVVIELILGVLKGILWCFAVAFRGIADGLFWLHDHLT